MQNGASRTLTSNPEVPMSPQFVRLWPCALLLLLACELSAQSPAASQQPNGGSTAPNQPVQTTPAVSNQPAEVIYGAPAAATPVARQGPWKVLYEENFEGPAPFASAAPSWSPDTFQYTDEYADGGSHFPGVKPPKAYRIEAPFSQSGWLTVAAYSRSNSTPFAGLFSVVPDPANPANHVLRVASPKSTDGLVIRPTKPLPPAYRVCLRAGYANFGDGKPGGKNGYAGGETAEPWGDDDSSAENGFYWLTILDAVPRPHNNIWIHHHRKVVIDSDNNRDAWTNIWEGKSWVADGRHPIMMFGLDKTGWDSGNNGLPFLSWSHGALQPSGEIRAVDAYKDNTWYSVCIERNPNDFVLSISGDFKFGGQQTYIATIPIGAVYQAEPGIPDYFMFGDPHNNYYRGFVYYDDIRLEVPAEK